MIRADLFLWIPGIEIRSCFNYILIDPLQLEGREVRLRYWSVGIDISVSALGRSVGFGL